MVKDSIRFPLLINEFEVETFVITNMGNTLEASPLGAF
jgi:hypothetical protein